MNNNDLLRRLRYLLDAETDAMVSLFALGGVAVDPQGVPALCAREDDPDAVECTDAQLEAFLDGLVHHKRGPYDGPPRPKVPLTNNEIFKKLRIAFSLRSTDVLALLEAGGHTGSDGRPIGETELSALFRAPDHRHFRACGDQVLRKFLVGLTERERSG